MTDLEDMRAAALELTTELGTTCTLQSITATFSAGAVTESVATFTAFCSPLQDESKRYETMDTSQRVSGTLYLAQFGLTTAPKVGDRIVFESRNFAVLAVMPLSIQTGAAAYRVDLAELGTA